MSFTQAEEARIAALERVVNKMQGLMVKFPSQTQFHQLIVMYEKQLDDLTNRVAALESQITILQDNLS